MKKIGLLVNKERDTYLECTNKFVSLFEAQGREVGIYDDKIYTPDSTFFDEIEALFVLGGDGTILNGAQLALMYRVPVIGINLGRLGFLADFDVNEMEHCVERYCAGAYTTRERTVLEACIINGDKEEVFRAINDIGLVRGQFSRIIHVDVLVNGERVDNYPCDGMLAASPTGSTAYSLSAGGPIVSPKLDCMVLTPVCAHKLTARPLVVSGNDEIEFRLTDGDTDTMLICDGKLAADSLKLGFVVKIRKSSLKSRFISILDQSFYGLLRDKLI